MTSHAPINPKLPKMLYGGDYNPEQWLKRPDILAEDIRLMKLCGCNSISVGIFSWSTLEPTEGEFNLEWLDSIINTMYENGIHTMLATPSGARPAWLAEKYPQVLRTTMGRQKELFGRRHNHCFTSPAYREKVAIINKKLAQRYKDNPAVYMWHISNEYNGECHCELCNQAFRDWLRAKYISLDALNDAWYTTFWSHTISDWSQIHSPTENEVRQDHGLILDWRRFVTYQTADFLKLEIDAVRQFTDIPVTINLPGLYPGLDYWKIKDLVDYVSWDCYPLWRNDDEDIRRASDTAFHHNTLRSLKDRPFLMTESTPSHTNWYPVNKLKTPGMNILSSMQAVALGSEGVMYFQWRKSRGSSEKFHGAVVDHSGHENTRVFREAAELGKQLTHLDAIVGTTTPARAAIIFDWENMWAINDFTGFSHQLKDYQEVCHDHHWQLWKKNIMTDIIDSDQPFDRYKLIIAPMLYMVKQGVAEKIERFVQGGGTFVASYMSGFVNETDLCYLGGFPGPLRKVLGIWNEETDSLLEDMSVPVTAFGKEYNAVTICDLLHSEGAEVLGRYNGEFYSGMPAFTCNNIGEGKAYYIGFRSKGSFLDDFYENCIYPLPIDRAMDIDLPVGVSAAKRTDGDYDYIFIMNFTQGKIEVPLSDGYTELFTGHGVNKLIIEKHEYKILRRKSV